MSKFEVIKSAYDEIKTFLVMYQNIWNKEVIDSYPAALYVYRKEWITDLSKLSYEELEAIDSRTCDFSSNQHPLYHSELGILFRKIAELEAKWNPPAFHNSSQYTLNKNDSLFLKPKKKYEIENLIFPLKEFLSKLKIHEVFDLGGGVGHLARIISSQLDENKDRPIKVTSIDINSDFQKFGTRKWKKIKKIHFSYLNADLNTLDIEKLGENNYATIGLHTCGELALSQFRLMNKNKAQATFNVPCCYQHLKLSSANFSNHSKLDPFPWTVFALTLSAKAHFREETNSKHQKSFQDKWQVKNYRYALQMILLKHGRADVNSVGEATFEDYYGPFSLYALSKLPQFNINAETAIGLEKFFQKNETQQELKKLFLCNIIRWQFGRLLELLIIYDRILWGLENGLKVDCFSVFDQRISPRNIAIVLTK